jgi:MFS family permease
LVSPSAKEDVMPLPPDREAIETDSTESESTQSESPSDGPAAASRLASSAVPGGRSTMSNARFQVLGVLCLLSGVLYLDRICISAAIDSIQSDLNISNTQTSYFLMAFTLAYGLFEIPTGRWGDRLGARRVLTRISLWWSAFTALTGACTGLWSLVTVRFLFGAGEAGAFPNMARVMSRWFPDHERGRAQGVLLAASQVGGALAPFLAAVLIQAIGWRLTFVAFGSVGAVWAAGFYLWFRDDPPIIARLTRRKSPTLGAVPGRRTCTRPFPGRWWLGTQVFGG